MSENDFGDEDLGEELDNESEIDIWNNVDDFNENQINELSIGMSNDYEEALRFNPTYIRLGTILFGKRIWKIN